LKATTEVIPLKDLTGIVSALHKNSDMNEIEQKGYTAIGKYPVEMIIDILEPGSIFGMY